MSGGDTVALHTVICVCVCADASDRHERQYNLFQHCALLVLYFLKTQLHAQSNMVSRIGIALNVKRQARVQQQAIGNPGSAGSFPRLQQAQDYKLSPTK